MGFQVGNLREVCSFLRVEIPGKEHLMAKHGNVKDSDKYEPSAARG